MNFLADESVDQPIIDRLRQAGHLVVAVSEMAPGMSDDDVLQQANLVGATLLTSDKDFGDLVFRQGKIHAGVILLRLSGMSNAGKADVVERAVRQHGNQMSGGFSVVSPGAVRIRRNVP